MSQALSVQPQGEPLSGELRLPGDKSISHRALIFSALARGESRLEGLSTGEDVASTRRALEALGVEFEGSTDAVLRVRGVGLGGLRAPLEGAFIDCGNSGTTVRLLAGAVAQGEGTFTFTGDASLSRRPMERVAGPLRKLGARVATAESGTLPLAVVGPVKTAAIIDAEVASAQVKSAVLLAGLSAPGVSGFRSPLACRDHTERMLRAMGCPVEESTDEAGVAVWLEGPAKPLAPLDLRVPADPSSAAFLAVAAALIPGSRLRLPGLLANPGRLRFLHWLEAMGVVAELQDPREESGEPVADLVIRGTKDALGAVEIPAGELPSIIDEVPILAVAASRARGITVFRGAGELRHKESDRLQGTLDLLAADGTHAWAEGDDLLVEGQPGPPPERDPAVLSVFQGQGDHRLAMAGVVLALAGRGGRVEGVESIAISYPEFTDDLGRLGATV